MDEYVTVEAYDVMLGSNTYSAGGSDPNRASDATVKTMNVYGSNHDEVEAKIVPYLNMYGGSYVSSIGCS